MNDKQKEKIKEGLAIQLEQYVKIILKEYGDVIKTEDIIRLKQINDYKDMIRIANTGTISCLVTQSKIIFFPETVHKMLNALKLIPGRGINKNHRAYNVDNVVLNENTFETYMKHLFIKGADAKEFYEENLLHESLHFCGSGGVGPLLEGLTEYRTRELAKKYNLKTTGCGYPKEVKIIDELQQIFGDKFLNMYLFDKGGHRSWEYLGEHFGPEAQDFFKKVEWSMEDEFRSKYFDKTQEFNGLLAPLKKTKAYSSLNYEETYNLIRAYKEGKKKSEQLGNKEESISNSKSNNNERATKEQINLQAKFNFSNSLTEKKSATEKFVWKNDERQKYEKIKQKNQSIAMERNREKNAMKKEKTMVRVRTMPTSNMTNTSNSKGITDSGNLILVIGIAIFLVYVILTFIVFIRR